MIESGGKATVGQVRRATEIAWNDEQLAAAAAELPRKRRRRAQQRWGTASALALVVLAGGVWGWRARPRSGGAPASSIAVAPSQAGFSFVDGIDARPLGPDARLALALHTPGRVDVRLDAGGARFEAKPAARELWVQAGRFQVVVRGSSVTMALGAAGDLRVEVHAGEARVVDGNGAGVRVPAGETRVLAPTTMPAPAPVAVESAPPVSRRWRALAERGQYEQAYRSLHREGPAAVRDDVDDLMLAADAARLSGHADRALGFLDEVRRRHTRDPRASLAAFTAGSLLLHRLDRPRDAAGAFAQARSLDRAGGLREDALAREVEAWHRAGERTLAQARARDYLARYPQGRWTALVGRLTAAE